MFILTPKPLEFLDIKSGLATQKAGGFVCFEGLVRNHNDGKDVVALEYEAFPLLAEKEANRIFDEVRTKFKISNAKCVHRTGKLNVGEMAVWVGVAAEHREDALQACRYIIDNIKTRVPIWKKEYYARGDSGWVNCDACQHASIQPESPLTSLSESEYYSRQKILPEVGIEGQKKLKKAKVLVVGAGGLGTPALQYLAAAGIGTIGICEFDSLEASNLHRQVLYSHKDLGEPKSKLASQRLKALNPFINIKIHPGKLTVENVEALVRKYDLIIDGSDNFLAKYLMNDAAVLNGIPLVVGSVYQLEGQLRFIHSKGKFSCLRCLWPNIPSRACVGSCVETGIIGVVPGIVGTYQALEAIKYFLGIPTLGKEDMLIFDFISGATKTIRIPHDPVCPLCGKKRTIKRIDLLNYKDDLSADADIDLDISSIPREELPHFKLVDIRETEEIKNNPVHSRLCSRIPLSTIQKGKYDFKAQEKYLFFCGKGGRSHRLAVELRGHGILSAFSIRNGVTAVKKYLKG